MTLNEDRIARLVDKTMDFDKDERYMATSDLCNELNSNAELGSFLEGRVCAAVLKQLDDKSNDVQSIAVKCLGILVTKVQDAQVIDICTKLTEMILEGKAELRDIYSIGLKTILADVSITTGTALALPLGTRLQAGLQRDTPTAIKAETLDILTDLLRRFGQVVAGEHEVMMRLVLAQLTDDSPLVRKRATACVGSLGVMISDALLTQLVEHLIAGTRAAKQDDTRTLIQTIGTLSRCAGHRLGQHLHSLIPILADFCGDPDDEDMQNEATNELRENCFHAFESFVARCHQEMTPHLDSVLRLASTFVTFDPNYNYGDSADEDEDMDDDEEFSDADDGDYSDDDDTSWKVRRAALRVVVAVITTRPQLLQLLHEQTSPLLVSRFKEREENVRNDVLNAFGELLRATRKALPAPGQPVDPVIEICQREVAQRTQAIVLAANKQFGPKASLSSRCAVLAMLTQLALLQTGKLGAFVDVLMPNLLRAAEDKHSDLKLESMAFLRLLLETHDVAPLAPHVDDLVRVSTHAARGDWYKTVAKALGLIEALAPVLRPDPLQPCEASAQPHVIALFDAVLVSLESHDLDHEIKEAAIACMGQLVARVGDVLGSRVNSVLPLLLDRVHNEITRVQAMKALAMIARSPLQLDLASIQSECTTTLSQLLRQQSRTLKQAAIDALNAFVQHRGAALAPELHASVVQDAAALLVDQDLLLCQLGLSLVSNVLTVSPTVAQTPAIRERVLSQVLDLACSDTLQGGARDALQHLFVQLTPLLTFEALFKQLFAQRQSDELSKAASINVARCVAAVCAAAEVDQQQRACASFVGAIQHPTTDKHAVLALHCLGEFGRRLSLETYQDMQPMLLQAFAATNEDIKAAAAYALGSICVGNMAAYLEIIIRKLEQGDNAYLLLTSLREVITHDGVSIYIDRVLPVLQTLSDREEEGVRNMVAECLGKMAISNAAKLAPVIKVLAVAESERSRWTGMTSMRVAATASAQDDRIAPLFSSIDELVQALQDPDLSVRRAALVALNTTAHHHARFLADRVASDVLPVLLQIAELKMERVVDLGPFKHRVDDALPLRKAAYSCVDTLLHVLPQQCDVSALVAALQHGLRDQDDVQMLSHQIVARLCIVQPGAMLGALDHILEPLDKTIHKKVKEDQVGTEVERTKDLIRSGLRVVDALSRVRDTEQHPKFAAFYAGIQQEAALAAVLEAIRADRVHA